MFELLEAQRKAAKKKLREELAVWHAAHREHDRAMQEWRAQDPRHEDQCLSTMGHLSRATKDLTSGSYRGQKKKRRCGTSTFGLGSNVSGSVKMEAGKSKSKPEFTLLRQPDADDLAKLFEQQIGRDVSEEEKQEMEKILAKRRVAALRAHSI